jgi:hypothetical protein
MPQKSIKDSILHTVQKFESINYLTLLLMVSDQMSQSNLEDILKNWTNQNGPQEIKDKIYEVVPELKNERWINCCQSLDNANEYIFFKSTYNDICCRVNATTGHYERLSSRPTQYIPKWWVHLVTLTGHSLLGDPINLICGEWTGLYIMHIDRPTSDWACEYDAHGNLLFADLKNLQQAIKICQDQFKFKLELIPDNELDLLSSSWSCACRELGTRQDLWVGGQWTLLQIKDEKVSDWAEMQHLESSIIRSEEEFQAKFPSYTCEQWYCDHCHKSFGIAELYHCPEQAKVRGFDGTLHIHAINSCETCLSLPTFKDYNMVKWSDKVSDRYKELDAEIEREKDGYRKAYNQKRGGRNGRGGFSG